MDKGYYHCVYFELRFQKEVVGENDVGVDDKNSLLYYKRWDSYVN